MGNTTSKSKPAVSKPISFTYKQSCHLTEVKETAEHIGSFLKAPDLAILCQASKSSQLLFSKQLHEMALLKAVFDANPEQVQKILKLPVPLKSKCIVLTKTHIKETYFSKKLNKTGVKREWTNISPLEAAAWCGDIFLVRALLLYVPQTQKPEACRQLKGILERKESEQNGTYLAPYRALTQSYRTYHGQYIKFFSEDNWDELKKLWNEIWQRQRLLPTYGLQEYCNNTPFGSLTSFILPPSRTCYLYNDPKQLLDLDSMNFGWALYKGERGAGGCCYGSLQWRVTWCAGGDLAALYCLWDKRIIDLGNIIKELEGPKFLEGSDFDEDKDSTARP